MTIKMPDLTLLPSWRRLVLVVLALVVAAFVAGYCARGMEPEARQAVATADSARIASVAFDKGQALAAWRAKQTADSLARAVAAADVQRHAAQGVTDHAAQGTAGALQAAQSALTRVKTSDSANRAALAEAGAALVQADTALRGFKLATLKERQANAALVQTLASDTAAKAREIARLTFQADTLRGQRDDALSREHRLAESIGGWRIALSVGPVIAYANHTLVASPVAGGITLSHPIQLPRLLPRWF